MASSTSTSTALLPQDMLRSYQFFYPDAKPDTTMLNSCGVPGVFIFLPAASKPETLTGYHFIMKNVQSNPSRETPPLQRIFSSRVNSDGKPEIYVADGTPLRGDQASWPSLDDLLKYLNRQGYRALIPAAKETKEQPDAETVAKLEAAARIETLKRQSENFKEEIRAAESTVSKHKTDRDLKLKDDSEKRAQSVLPCIETHIESLQNIIKECEGKPISFEELCSHFERGLNTLQKDYSVLCKGRERKKEEIEIYYADSIALHEKTAQGLRVKVEKNEAAITSLTRELIESPSSFTRMGEAFTTVSCVSSTAVKNIPMKDRKRGEMGTDPSIPTTPLLYTSDSSLGYFPPPPPSSSSSRTFFSMTIPKSST